MTQLYVPDKSWLVCSDGMNMQQLKVTSQTSIKIADGKLAATIHDRTGKNFTCGKMLIAGAIIGAAIATIMVVTGGLGFFAAIGAIIGGTIAGAAIGTLISLIPCFCAIFTLSYNWVGCHEEVFFEKKQALLENATLLCMLGGKIEIHIFKQIAELRLDSIRRYVLIEALIRSVEVSLFLKFPKTFIFGAMAADLVSQFYCGPKAKEIKELILGLQDPNTALRNINIPIPYIGGDGKYLIIDNVSRFQIYLQDAENRPSYDYPWPNGETGQLLETKDEEGNYEGTQSNAFRHVLWQSTLTVEFGEEKARQVANSHEDNHNFAYNPEGYSNMNDADIYADLRNNEIGRRIGAENPDAPLNVLAGKVLDEYYQNGLWEVVKIGDRYFPVQTRLPEDQYSLLKEAVDMMNRLGYYDHTLEQLLKNLGATEDEIKMLKTIPKAKH